LCFINGRDFHQIAAKKEYPKCTKLSDLFDGEALFDCACVRDRRGNPFCFRKSIWQKDWSREPDPPEAKSLAEKGLAISASGGNAQINKNQEGKRRSDPV
jgi:hypothetical protein